MEQLNLSNPVTTPAKTTSTYKLVSLLLNLELVTPPGTEPGLLAISLKDNLGQSFAHQYTGKEAIDLIKWMNTANFTTASMHKKILQKLSADGVLPGTVTGSPDPPTAEL